MKKVNTGTLGEVYAARYLREHGYRILCTNYHSRFGEIDLIACDEKYLAFVEVKTRTGNFQRPCEAVDRSKQGKLIRTAACYLAANRTELQPRFDVLEIYLNKEDANVKEVNYMKNAFTMEAAGEYF